MLLPLADSGVGCDVELVELSATSGTQNFFIHASPYTGISLRGGGGDVSSPSEVFRFTESHSHLCESVLESFSRIRLLYQVGMSFELNSALFTSLCTMVVDLLVSSV